MTITVSCPSCATSFPVDPAKVPPEGVRAQCSNCPEIFEVDRPSEAALDASPAPESTFDSVETTESPEFDSVDLPSLDGSFETAESTDFGAIDMSIDAGPPDTSESTTEVVDAEATPFSDAPVETEKPVEAVEPPATPSAASTEGSVSIRFGRRSPEDKAKSLARSLVSDLVAYNPEKHKEALAEGTLQEVFREEIEKSLKEYQEQVTPEVMAQGEFFNDALNSILGEGQSIFGAEG